MWQNKRKRGSMRLNFFRTPCGNNKTKLETVPPLPTHARRLDEAQYSHMGVGVVYSEAETLYSQLRNLLHRKWMICVKQQQPHGECPKIHQLVPAIFLTFIFFHYRPRHFNWSVNNIHKTFQLLFGSILGCDVWSYQKMRKKKFCYQKYE